MTRVLYCGDVFCVANVRAERKENFGGCQILRGLGRELALGCLPLLQAAPPTVQGRPQWPGTAEKDPGWLHHQASQRGPPGGHQLIAQPDCLRLRRPPRRSIATTVPRPLQLPQPLPLPRISLAAGGLLFCRGILRDRRLGSPARRPRMPSCVSDTGPAGRKKLEGTIERQARLCAFCRAQIPRRAGKEAGGTAARPAGGGQTLRALAPLDPSDG